MIASPMCFFRDLYSKLRASWCSIRDAKNTLVMSKRSAEKKSARRGNQLVKQELVTVSKKKSPYTQSISNQQNVQSQNVYCGSCSFNLYQAHGKFSPRRMRVPLTVGHTKTSDYIFLSTPLRSQGDALWLARKTVEPCLNPSIAP